MNRVARIVTILAASTALVVGAGLPAGAASDGVSISKISSPKAGGNGKATIKPKVKRVGKARLDAATLTVKKGRKTVARNKRSVKLKAGTYKVTTRVSYQIPVTTRSSTTKTTRAVGVPAGTQAEAQCTVGGTYQESIAEIEGVSRHVAYFDATCRGSAFDPLALKDLAAVYLDELEMWAAYDGPQLVFVILGADYWSLDRNQTVDSIVEPEYDLYKTTTQTVTTSRTTWQKRSAARTQTVKVRKRR